MPDLSRMPAAGAGALLWSTAVVLLWLFALTLLVQRLDRRRLNGESVWAKPLKFQISLAIHFATLALIAGWLTLEARTSALLYMVAVLATGSTAFEVGYIAIQAARRQASHFCRRSRARQARYGRDGGLRTSRADRGLCLLDAGRLRTGQRRPFHRHHPSDRRMQRSAADPLNAGRERGPAGRLADPASDGLRGPEHPRLAAPR